MNNELISIIVPAYNVESYLKRTIESILNQTYTNIEIICVNDGSTDNTYQRLKFIAASDKRVRVFTKANEGVTLARKYGVEQAKGEYIGFVDADDEIDPTMYERLYHNLKQHNADISHCGHEVFYLDGRREYFYNTGRLAKQDMISGLQSLISGSFEPGLCNKLYHYTLLHSLFHNGAMDYSITINEDLLMNYYLFKSAKNSIFEDVCLYHYLKREGSASNSKISSSWIWDQIRVKQIILSDAMGTEYETDARRAYLITCLTRLNSLIMQNDAAFEEDCKKIIQLVKDKKADFNLLSKKQKLGAKLLITSPELYKILIRRTK